MCMFADADGFFHLFESSKKNMDPKPRGKYALACTCMGMGMYYNRDIHYISNAFIIFLDKVASLASRAFLSSLPKAAAKGGGTAFPTCLCLF